MVMYCKLPPSHFFSLFLFLLQEKQNQQTTKMPKMLLYGMRECALFPCQYMSSRDEE